MKPLLSSSHEGLYGSTVPSEGQDRAGLLCEKAGEILSPGSFISV